MADLDAETRDTNMELNDSRKESDQVTEHEATEVGVRSNYNTNADSDETHGRCYSCFEFCQACCKPCMTEHNPLSASPTRFDIINFLSVVALHLCYIGVVHCIDAVHVYLGGSV